MTVTKARSVMAVLGCAAALALAACDGEGQNAARVEQDVARAQDRAAEDLAEAREEAAKDIADAEREVAQARREFSDDTAEAGEKLREVEADALDARAKAGYDLAITKAEARHKVALERCDGLERALANVCIADADAALVVDRAAAERQREATIASIEADRTDADAGTH